MFRHSLGDGSIGQGRFTPSWRPHEVWNQLWMILTLALFGHAEEPDPGNTSHIKPTGGTSLVAQWLRIRLPMQGTQV